ncbi:chaperonin [Culex quinquefasciatus]|uniref:Chaperonin n=1 Tax=Culex quinquefasciatus TaxID=7176 RepID=B0WDL3_CULQU|nr:chaperonin [Culex quinquefasciatus]|eukprot:XP_001846797.1 chaperonin [Culex quinquefasciatus]
MAHHILYAFALIVIFPQRIAETFAEEEEDEIARLSSFVVAIGDLIKITLGPKGMDMDMIQVAIMKAVCAARSALIAAAQVNSTDAEKFREDMMNISWTTLSSRIRSQQKEYFAKLVVDAVMQLLRGFVLGRGFPAVQEARCAPVEAHRERNDLGRQHADGHGQDPGYWIEHQDGLDGEYCRAGGRREGVDDGQGDNPDQVRPGRCDLIEQVNGGDPLGEACTVVIHGAMQQIIDEADHSLHAALRVLAANFKEARIVYEGG